MTQQTVETSPRLKTSSSYASPRFTARMAGVLYLCIILLGMFAQGYVSGRLVVFGNASATANNIVAQESLYRLGFAVYLIEMACQITLTMLFYGLLKPVSRSVSLLAAIFGLTACVIKTVARLFFFAPLLVLGNAHYLSVFSTEQLEALGLLFLRVNYTGENIAMVFFGLYAVVKGYLVFRSIFWPRILGVLTAVGGLGWLTYLYEPLASRLLPFILAASLVGALANVFWLLVFGLNEQRWKEQAADTL